MAGSSIIGALRVVIGADTAALEKGLSSAQGSLSKFAGGLGKGLAAVGAAAIAAGAAIGIAVKNAIDEADNLGKMAQSFGVPIEELSRLKHAADLSGVGIEDLGKSVGRLSKAMVETAGGGVGPATQAFTALGISVKNTDGTLKSSGGVMTELAGKFENMEDGAGKTALAMALFGKQGASLIPLLNAGADGLREMMEEADALGIVIDGRTAKSAEAFNDNLTRLGKAKDGIILQVTARMLPAFQSLSQLMIDAAKNTGLMDTAASVLTFTLRSLVSAGVIVGAVFKTVWEAIATTVQAVLQVVEGDFTGAWATMQNVTQDAASNIKSTIRVLGTVWDSTAGELAAKAPETAKKLAAPILQATASAQDAIGKFLEATTKRSASMEAEAQTVGLSAAAHERLRVALTAQAIAKQNDIVLTAQQTEAIRLAGEQAALAAERLKGAQLTQEMLQPWELLNQKLEQNRQLFEAGAISAETYARANQAAAEHAGATWQQASSSMASSFSEIAQSFGKENSRIVKAAQILGAVQAFISTLVGQAEALKLPFPANLAAMALIAAKGFALVAAIKSASVPKFTTGGSFRVGGSGGEDSQRVSFDASPGEIVDIRRPADGAGGAGGNRTLTVQAPPFGSIFTGRNMRELLEAIQDAQRDGYTLAVA
jgi:hypothetical protein